MLIEGYLLSLLTKLLGKDTFRTTIYTKNLMFIYSARYYITTFAITTPIDPIKGLVEKK